MHLFLYNYLKKDFIMCEDFIKLESFSPKGKTFCFILNRDTCYRIYSGHCPLDTGVNPAKKEGSSTYCKKLSLALYSTFQRDPVAIVKCKCGHYTFINGQHRTCIAGRLGYNIPVDYFEDDDNCAYCNGTWKGSFLVTF